MTQFLLFLELNVNVCRARDMFEETRVRMQDAIQFVCRYVAVIQSNIDAVGHDTDFEKTDK